METTQFNTDRFTALLEQNLGGPNCQVGMKLRSVRELSRTFGINISKVRTSIDRLEKKGLLISRQGSGTYVRRLSSAEKALSEELEPVSSELLFKEAKGNSEATNKDTLLSSKLTFALWSNFQTMSTRNNTLMYTGLSRVLSGMGHSLQLLPIQDDQGHALSPERIREIIADNRVDGHLVIAGWRYRFEEALESSRYPVVYFGAGMMRHCYHSTIMNNTHQAVAYAVDFLSREGLDKIGYFGLSQPNVHFEHQLYDLAMTNLPTSYRMVELYESGALDDLSGCVQAAGRLLDRPDRPEALYVADDSLMGALDYALKERKLVAGRDIAIICLSNRGCDLPGGTRWSRLEFNPELIGTMAAKKLIGSILDGRYPFETISVDPMWIPGQTHRMSR